MEYCLYFFVAASMVCGWLLVIIANRNEKLRQELERSEEKIEALSERNEWLKGRFGEKA